MPWDHFGPGPPLTSWFSPLPPHPQAMAGQLPLWSTQLFVPSPSHLGPKATLAGPLEPTSLPYGPQTAHLPTMPHGPGAPFGSLLGSPWPHPAPQRGIPCPYRGGGGPYLPIKRRRKGRQAKSRIQVSVIFKQALVQRLHVFIFCVNELSWLLRRKDPCQATL